MHQVLWRRRIYLFAFVTLVTALFTALSASGTAYTANGAGALSSADCGPSGAVTLDHPGLLRGATAARASENIVREPSLGTAEEVPASKKGKGGKGFRATVDTWVHIVSDGAIGNVSDQAVRRQIDVMNTGFAGREGGVATGFTFRLAGITRTDNAAWYYAGPTTKEERDMKKALRRGDASVLNIYVTTAGVYLGWAYFPSTYKTQPYLDGLVIDWESMLGTSTRYEDRYDLGKTATHEAGHWFGLYHVFQGGCNAKGDYVDDTPPQSIATFGCPEGQDSCTRDPGIDSIHNYMDYSFDSCYNQFTAGQAARMQDQWLFFRADGGSTAQG
jgi:hypothetical protein